MYHKSKSKYQHHWLEFFYLYNKLIEYYVDENEKNIAVLIDPETGNRRTDLKLRSQDIRLLGTSYYAYINKIVSMINYELHLIE